MKSFNKIIIIKKCLFIAFTIIATPMTSTAQKIKGNKIIIQEIRLVNSNFDSIDCSAIGSVVIAAGAIQNKIVIETDENIQPYIKTERIGNKIKIFTTASLQTSKCKAIVYCSQLKNIKAISCGKITTTGDSLTFDDINIDADAVGTIDMTCKATQLQIKARSVGNLILKGTSNSAILDCSSIGILNLLKFKIGELTAKISSTPNAQFYVLKDINIISSAIIKLIIKGNPHFSMKNINDYTQIKMID